MAPTIVNRRRKFNEATYVNYATEPRFILSNDDAAALIALCDNDLGAAIAFANAQAEAIEAERAIQNEPPDER